MRATVRWRVLGEQPDHLAEQRAIAADAGEHFVRQIRSETREAERREQRRQLFRRERCLAAGMDNYIASVSASRNLCRLIEKAAGAAPVRAAAAVADGSAGRSARARRRRSRAARRDDSALRRGRARTITRIRSAVDVRDSDALRRAARALKGAAANFEAADVVQAARRLEEMGQSGQFEGEAAALRSLTIEMDRLMARLTALAT